MGESENPSPKRHCWECLRRCVVCDSTRPACNRCTAAGSACPGYGDVKPRRLVWLEPGKVKSRARKRKGSPSPSPALSAESAELQVQTHPASSPHAYPSGLDSGAIPRFGADTDADALVHAAEYFNVCIYQDLIPLRELGDNPAIYQISPSLIRKAISRPDYLQLGMLCMVLSHRMNRTLGDSEVNNRALTEKFYTHRGNAIRSLRELLNQESHRARDIVIAGIVTLLLVDLQQGASLNWRPHVEGAIKLIQLRGGFAALANKALEPQLVFLCFMAVIGNTTCPASDISITPAHLAALDIIPSSTLAPFQMCPPPLFAEIIRINHLRLRATQQNTHAHHHTSDAEPDSLAHEAYSILSRIHAFSPADWASTKPRAHDDWVLVGRIHHAAVALYWASALQSVGLPIPTVALQAECAERVRLLRDLLARGVASPKVRQGMLWPLVVLGVLAAGYNGYGDDGHGESCGQGGIRDFVASQLPVLARHGGTYMPLVAKGVLERFWASGETRWDACFDRPYAFVMLIAVDTSRIMDSERVR